LELDTKIEVNLEALVVMGSGFVKPPAGELSGVWFEHVWECGANRVSKKFNFFFFAKI
jgi:hypothetical protein